MPLMAKLQNPKAGTVAFQGVTLYQSLKLDPRSDNLGRFTEQLLTLGVGGITYKGLKTSS